MKAALLREWAAACPCDCGACGTLAEAAGLGPKPVPPVEDGLCKSWGCKRRATHISVGSQGARYCTPHKNAAVSRYPEWKFKRLRRASLALDGGGE